MCHIISFMPKYKAIKQIKKENKSLKYTHPRGNVIPLFLNFVYKMIKLIEGFI